MGDHLVVGVVMMSTGGVVLVISLVVILWKWKRRIWSQRNVG